MNPQLILICIAVGFVSVAVVLIARRLLERRRDEGAALVPSTGEVEVEPAQPDLAGRMDRSFEKMMFQTGLGFSTSQTLWLFIFTALACAALMFFWSDEEWAAALGAAIGVGLLVLVFRFLQARRLRAFQEQLPDAFFFLSRSLRAGLSLEQALARGGDQLDEPLAAELRRCTAQMQLGLHPYKALANTAARIDLRDFDIFVSTIGLYYHGGGNLPLLLDRLAASARDRIQFQGYFRAATALGRAAGFLLAAAVPLLVLAYLILRPEHVGPLFETPAGWQLLAIAGVLELIGIVWFFYLLRIEY